MIKKLYTVETDNTNPYRNLAIEHYLTMNMQDGECCLFLWQNKRTVVIGKNQNAYAECNTDALLKDGGLLARRLSGGGAVFHDIGNLNFSFCVKRSDFDIKRQSNVIIHALKELKIDARQTGRNDLTLQGRKFSGHAFFNSGSFCCHHGTILMDTDSSLMMKYLTPDKEKLELKGVRSVKSRVINLSELSPDINKESLSECLKKAFCKGYRLSCDEISKADIPESELAAYEKKFASQKFIFGENVTFTEKIKKRFEWGGVELLLNVTDGIINEVQVYSDCMDADMPKALRKKLTGYKYSEDEILRILDLATP